MFKKASIRKDSGYTILYHFMYRKYKRNGDLKTVFKKFTYSIKKFIGAIVDLISSIVIALLP